MWLIGALIGLVVFLPAGNGIWLFGAALGGFLGWGVGHWRAAREAQRARDDDAPESGPTARPSGPDSHAAFAAPPAPGGADRLGALEIRLIAELNEIKRRLDRLDARLAGTVAPAASGDSAERSPQVPEFLPIELAPVPVAPSARELDDLAAASRAAAIAPARAELRAEAGSLDEATPRDALAAAASSLAPAPVAPPPAEQGATVPEPAAREPAAPREPTWFEQLPGMAWHWLTGGNTVVRVGVVILFFGVAFLLRYAYERIHVAIELRLVGVAAGAIVLLLIGWRLRTSREGYALTLQAAAVGLLYLTVFAAFRLYGVLPPAAAFGLLVAIAVFSAMLAVLQDSRTIAVLGASGGFLAPILASTGGGSHVMLFSYYAVLNAGILAVAWFKAWRLLNLVGFAFTFAIGTLWGTQFYRPAYFASTEPFLVLFFLFYVAIPLLFARREAPRLRHYVDGTLVFGVPLVAFGLQLGLVKDIEYAAAFSALALAGFYLLLARFVHTRGGTSLGMLAEAFLALGIVFGTLAIPLGLDGRWTSAAWALEGAAILWVGVRQKRIVARVFGALLQVGAGIAFLGDVNRPAAALPFANSFYLGCFFVAVAGFFSSWYLARRRDDVSAPEQQVAWAFFGWGILWWVLGALREVDLHVAADYRAQAALLYFTVSCAAFSWLERRLEWPVARYPALALLPVMVVAAAIAFGRQSHPFAHLGWVAWPLAFAGHFFVLHRHDEAANRYLYWAHAVGLWLLATLGAWQVGWGIDELVAGKAVWPAIAWALVPGAILVALALAGQRDIWPLSAHRASYFDAGAAPLAVFLVLWTVWAGLTSSGDPAPLPYVAALNPLGLAQAGAVLAVALWFVAGRRLEFPNFTAVPLVPLYAALAVAAFAWLNNELLRTLHHWAGVPFRLDAMLRSDLVQTSFSILWTVVALGVMVAATRRALRVAWMVGAGIMAVVVLKLFIVDLSNVGTVTRIVSFIGVGVLMLLIGYFSPVPPKPREANG
jgi:uncharacterized membrane protein